MPQLQPDYYTTEVVSSKYTQPSLKFIKNNNNNKTYLKYRAKFTKFRKNAIIKFRIVSRTDNNKSKSKSPSRSRSSSNSTIFVDDISKSEDESCSCCEKVPNYTVTTTECSPRISLDELQDSLVESNDEKSVHLLIEDEKCAQVDDTTSVLPSSPPPQYKTIASSPNDQLDTSSDTSETATQTYTLPTANPHPPTPIDPTQIKFKSQLNQYLASLETEEIYHTEPYTSLKKYNKTTNQQYSRYQLTNMEKHQCINYYWLYLDIRQNNLLVNSLYISWYSWMSGLVTFMIIYALFVGLT